MTVTINQKQSRYELAEEGQTAYADYHIFGDTVSIDYVFSPPELRGKGTAGRLMEGIMQDVKSQGFKARPICGYAASWLKRHPEYNDNTAK